MAFGVISLVALPEGVRVRRGEERRGEAIRAIFRDRMFPPFFLVSSVLGAFVYFQAQTTFPLHVEASGLSAADYGLLISLNGLAIVLFELPLVSITQRFPYRPVLVVGSLLVGLGFALNAFANDLPELGFTVLVWTLGEIIYAPVAAAYVADLAPEHLRGRYQGAWGLTWGLAFVLAPGSAQRSTRGTRTGSGSHAVCLACWRHCCCSSGARDAPVAPSHHPWRLRRNRRIVGDEDDRLGDDEAACAAASRRFGGEGGSSHVGSFRAFTSKRKAGLSKTRLSRA